MESQFQFVNFTPTLRQETFVKERLMHICELAPSSSYTTATLKRTDVGYICRVEIFDEKTPFIADGTGDLPQFAVETMERSILEKLHDWKQHRFSGLSSH